MRSTQHTEKSTSLRLSIVVPTFNEAENIEELLRRLDQSLGRIGWEVIFVDDDSPDLTFEKVREFARLDSRVRCLRRVGRRGLSSACIEGMLAASAPAIAVMDADLQHDEAILPAMLSAIETGDADMVVGTRYGVGGDTGDWNKSRVAMSRLATVLSRTLTRQEISDPMSGFFMLRREVVDSTVRKLSGLGFKILLDILTAVTQPLRVIEIPYTFRNRFAGESKLDGMVIWEYGMLLADKTIGRFIPVRFVSFSAIGGLGAVVHLTVVASLLRLLGTDFLVAQSSATALAMLFNFWLNNLLTYRDYRLRGWRWMRGLVSFMAACSFGAVANVGVGNFLFERDTQWAVASLAGVLVGAVWNFAVTQMYTWKKSH